MDILAYFEKVLGVNGYQQLIKPLTIKKGRYIYMPPTKPADMFQILSGVVKIGTYSEEGQEICYDLLYRKEVFGNLRYLNGQFFEFAKAMTDCEVASIDLAFYKKMIVHDPIISDWFNQTTIQRWCRMETRLYKICTMSPIDRIHAIFQEFTGEVQDMKGKTIKIHSLLSLVDIAQMTGVSRQTVSKLINKKNKSIKPNPYAPKASTYSTNQTYGITARK
ncbi:MAG: Crp/Fnr family transcriptional regulator [Mongoliitalea sp.]